MEGFPLSDVEEVESSSESIENSDDNVISSDDDHASDHSYDFHDEDDDSDIEFQPVPLQNEGQLRVESSDSEVEVLEDDNERRQQSPDSNQTNDRPFAGMQQQYAQKSNHAQSAYPSNGLSMQASTSVRLKIKNSGKSFNLSRTNLMKKYIMRRHKIDHTAKYNYTKRLRSKLALKPKLRRVKLAIQKRKLRAKAQRNAFASAKITIEEDTPSNSLNAVNANADNVSQKPLLCNTMEIDSNNATAASIVQVINDPDITDAQYEQVRQILNGLNSIQASKPAVATLSNAEVAKQDTTTDALEKIKKLYVEMQALDDEIATHESQWNFLLTRKLVKAGILKKLVRSYELTHCLEEPLRSYVTCELEQLNKSGDKLLAAYAAQSDLVHGLKPTTQAIINNCADMNITEVQKTLHDMSPTKRAKLNEMIDKAGNAETAAKPQTFTQAAADKQSVEKSSNFGKSQRRHIGYADMSFLKDENHPFRLFDGYQQIPKEVVCKRMHTSSPIPLANRSDAEDSDSSIELCKNQNIKKLAYQLQQEIVKQKQLTLTEARFNLFKRQSPRSGIINTVDSSSDSDNTNAQVASSKSTASRTAGRPSLQMNGNVADEMLSETETYYCLKDRLDVNNTPATFKLVKVSEKPNNAKTPNTMLREHKLTTNGPAKILKKKKLNPINVLNMLCDNCHARQVQFVCSVCANKAYCSSVCQVADWERGHEESCDE